MFSTLKRGLPCLSDIQMSELSFASVKLSSSVTDNGNLDISARGFCWSTSPNPTIDNDQLQVGRGMGDFTKTISGLQEDTKYHIRSYATNETGTGYSNELTLTTGKRDIPILKTTIFEQINDTSVSVSSRHRIIRLFRHNRIWILLVYISKLHNRRSQDSMHYIFHGKYIWPTGEYEILYPFIRHQ